MTCKVFLSWLLNTSIKASILIGIIIFVKRLFKNNFGAKWHYYIWFLLLFRLVMPYSIQSPISILNLFSLSENDKIIGKSAIYYHPDKIISWFNPNIDLLNVEELANHQVVFTKYMNLLFNEKIASSLIIIWLVGVVVFTLYAILMNIKFHLNIKREILCKEDSMLKLLNECKLKMHIHKSLPLIKTKLVDSPSLYGLFRPCLLMPVDIEQLLSTKQLQYVMLHELSHLKRKDLMVCWFSTFLQFIHWFNPIISYGFYLMHHDREIACDALALSYIEDEENKSYGQTIIHLLENVRKISHPIGMVGILNTKSQLKRRIKMITLFHKNTYKLSIVSIVILVIIGSTFLTNATKPTTQNEKAPIISQVNQEQKTTIISSQTNQNENTMIKMLWPVPDFTKITSYYGKKKHPKLNVEKMHTGIDIAAPRGTSIVSVKEGTVIHSGEFGEYGNTLIIDHGNGIATMYGHCSELLVKKDTKVKSGETIAKIGMSGLSTGPHLHFEVRKDEEAVDPLIYVAHDEKM